MYVVGDIPTQNNAILNVEPEGALADSHFVPLCSLLLQWSGGCGRVAAAAAEQQQPGPTASLTPWATVSTQRPTVFYERSRVGGGCRAA